MDNDFLRILRRVYNNKAVTDKDWEDLEHARFKISKEVEELIPKNPEIALHHIEVILLETEKECYFIDPWLAENVKHNFEEGNDFHAYLFQDFQNTIGSLFLELIENMKAYFPGNYSKLRPEIKARGPRTLKKQDVDKQNKTNTEKSFAEFLLLTDREKFAELLKDEFKTEKGKGIRLMIEALQILEPPLIQIENRQRKAIFKALKKYFDRDIGTYQSIFDFNIGTIKDKKDFEAIKSRVKFVIFLYNNPNSNKKGA